MEDLLIMAGTSLWRGFHNRQQKATVEQLREAVGAIGEDLLRQHEVLVELVPQVEALTPVNLSRMLQKQARWNAALFFLALLNLAAVAFALLRLGGWVV